MKSTQSLKKKWLLIGALSYLLCFGLSAFLIISVLSNKSPSPEGVTITEKYGTVLVSLGMSIIIMAVLSIIVKDKLMPIVWMINIILSGYLFGLTCTYIVFGLWAVDNYVLKSLSAHYKSRYVINREIDRRDNG